MIFINFKYINDTTVKAIGDDDIEYFMATDNDYVVNWIQEGGSIEPSDPPIVTPALPSVDQIKTQLAALGLTTDQVNAFLISASKL